MFENAANNKLNNESRPGARPAPAGHLKVNIADESKVKKSGLIPVAEQFIKFYRLIFIVMAVLLIIICGAGIFSLYEPTIGSVKKAIADNQAVLAEKEQALNKLKSVKVSFDNIEESAQKILDVLPAEKDLPSLFVQLEALAFKHNLFLKTVDVSTPDKGIEETSESKKQELNKLVITLNISGGDYFTLKNFLADIEKNLRLLDIKSLSYTPQSNAYSLVIHTYYFGEKYEKAGSE